MNPDQNRSGTTLSGPFMLGSAISALVSVVAVILVAVIIASNSSVIFVVGGIAAVIVLIAIYCSNFLIIKKAVARNLVDMADICRSFANGDHAARAAVVGEDEMAQVASALNAALDNQGSLPVASVGPAGNDAAALQAQIEKLLQEVSAVGDGDLRVQAEVTPDTLGVLADSFNYMIEELAKVVGRVQSTAVQVTNATRRILDRSAELAQASDTQVKQIAQTTEAVEALAVFIQNVARNMQLSVDIAQETLHSASNGQQAVRQTIEGMMLIRENVQETAKKIKRLGERSNEIGEIVRIIEDIADQTNLLALNAAIQSAMAGEHGRGFAVVADEIRLLAERSTESTKRIATLVKSIQGDTYEAVVAMEDSTQEVVKGSQLADDAGRSLNSIYSAVERQAQMIENIARAANEQTSVSEAVAVAMGRISEITRQTDAGTQEAAVSVSYLAELSEQLRASVSTFRLPDRTGDMGGSFSNMSSAGELSDHNFPPLGGEGESAWAPSLSGNFPPLPEPGNTGSLVPLASQGGQLPRNGQFEGISPAGLPAANNPSSFSGIPSVGNPPSFGGAPFMGVGAPGVANNQSFAGNNQVDFGDFGGFDNAQFNNQGLNGSQQSPAQAFPQPGQPFYQPAANPGYAQLSNPGLPSSPFQQQPGQGQAQGSRPRWQSGVQNDQNQNQNQ
jgi:Methyl-accepting chemotaxis protein